MKAWGMELDLIACTATVMLYFEEQGKRGVTNGSRTRNWRKGLEKKRRLTFRLCRF
jgi:hypothetical protein